jgi:hypothetical protein
VNTTREVAMSQEEPRAWELWGITEGDWNAGWRRTLQEALDYALADAELGVSYEIQIFVRKRTRNSVHDYRVVATPTP